MVRGELFKLPAPKGAKGHEQRGSRYAVVVQADELLGLSTVLVSPTSASARPATFRPVIELNGQEPASWSSRRRSLTRNVWAEAPGGSMRPSFAP